MTKMYLLAKLTLTILGIFILLDFLSYLELPSRLTKGYSDAVVGPLLVTVVSLAPLCILAYYLLFKSDNLARKMVGSTNEDSSDVSRIWVVTGFRLTMFLCGVLIISGSIEFLVRVAGFVIVGPRLIINMIFYKYIDTAFRLGFREWLRLFVDVCRAVLGIYLVLGAPRFVRWQIRNLETCSRPKNVENQTL
jgi:hypothetical protein